MKKRPDRSEESDTHLEREIRNDRSFSLGEAIGRRGGSGLLKGASPVGRQQQLEMAVEDLLDQHLEDPEGALLGVLRRAAAVAAEISNEGPDGAPRLLRRLIDSMLENSHTLREAVRHADAEWGRLYDERPHFDRPGTPPHADDPYTESSVRARLEALRGQITEP